MTLRHPVKISEQASLQTDVCVAHAAIRSSCGQRKELYN